MNESIIGLIAGAIAGSGYVAFHRWDRRRHEKSSTPGKLQLPVSPLGMVGRWALVVVVAIAVLKFAPDGKLWFAGVFALIFTTYLIWDVTRGLSRKK